MSQSSYFKSQPDILTLGELEGETGNRYEIDITGLDPLSLVDLGGGVKCFV